MRLPLYVDALICVPLLHLRLLLRANNKRFRKLQAFVMSFFNIYVLCTQLVFSYTYYKYVYIYIYIYIIYIDRYRYIICIYTNLPVNVIVRLPHPRSGDSQGQEMMHVTM